MKLFLLICFLGFFSSCKYLVDTPYSSKLKTSLRNSNAKNITKIQALNLSNDFKFAFISDTHANYDDFSKVVNLLNQRSDLDFVVHGGDFTNLAYVKEYDYAVEILSRLKVPYLVVVGNHDAIAQGKEIYKKLFGDFNTSFSFASTKFILWNNCKLEFEKTFNFNWLSTELNNTGGATQIIVLQHINNFAADIFTSDEISNWQSILASTSPDLVLNGHMHKFSLTNFSSTSLLQASRVQGLKYSLVEFNSGSIHIDFCTGKKCARQ